MAAGIRLAGFALLAVAFLAGSSRSASASPAFRYWTSFGDGLLGGENHIAVDNSTGSSARDVYVADTYHYRVLKFSPEGELILMFGDEVDATTGGDVCTTASGDECKEGVPSPSEIPADEPSPGFASATELAVDGSTGTTAGDVYVVDQAHGRVLRFDSGGHRDTPWADEGELRTGRADGVAVDASGRLLVLESGLEEQEVRIFDSNAEEVGSLNVSAPAYPLAVDVDGSGHLYVPATNRQVDKLAPDGSRLKGFAVQSFDSGFAVDRANEDVFIAGGEHGISRFSANCPEDPCSPAESFGERYVSWAGDLAVDESDQTLYAINYGGVGKRDVAVLLPASQIPYVTTGAATVHGENAARLTGTIDSVGGPAAVDCRFEYVTEAVFEEKEFAGAPSNSCDQSMPITSRKDVSATLGGLQPGASYRFRLVVKAAAKTVAGFDESFKTKILPRATTGPVFGIETESAVLSGSLESPAARPVIKCEFELVPDSAYAASGFADTSSIACAPAPFYENGDPVDVSGKATFLQPGTTYRYRIAVLSSDGTVFGAGQVFVTTSVGRGPAIEEPEHPGPHRPSGKVPCSKKACTRLLDGSPRSQVWTSPRFPRTYGWLLEIFVDGNPLHHTALEKGCRSTFAGYGVIARLNGCNGRIRLVYRGSGAVRIRWRVYAHCRCAEAARASGVSVGVSGV